MLWKVPALDACFCYLKGTWRASRLSGCWFTRVQISRTGDWGYIGVVYGVMLDWVGSLKIIRTPWRHQPDVWETQNVPVMCWCHATQLSSKYLLQKSSISGKAEIAQSQVICLITLGLQPSQKRSVLHREVWKQPDVLSWAFVIIWMVILISKQSLILVLWKSQAQEKARGSDATSQPDPDAA